MSPVVALACIGGIAAVAAVVPAESAAAADNETCLACHGDPSASRAINPAMFMASVHGEMSCTTCHADADVEPPHPVPLSSVTQAAIPQTCGQCHGDVHEAFQRSVHGQAVAAGKRHAPVCTDCHGVHDIARVKSTASHVFAANIPETCGQCHAAERLISKYRLPAHVVGTYMESFHGLSLQLGSVTAANCASCHGAHAILPSTDPSSSIHPSHLPQTCGQCHAGVTAQVTRGKIHTGADIGAEHPVTGLVRRFYFWLILMVIGGMFVHNLLDFLKKFKAHYARVAAAGVRSRMSLNVRIQHGVVTMAFLTLAYTGFALKFPQAWWAGPFMGRTDWRTFGHRTAAALFCALALYHLGYVLFTTRGRHHVKALRPRRADLIQPFQMLGYSLGLRSERPVFARYSYVEKAEYWALVWGSIVMASTGALMTWERFTLRLFPKWFFDVIATVHYYEAVLACLAILVWHFYFVMFDPDEYPMKWTWITGKPSPADQTHRRDDPHHRNENDQ